MNNLPTQNTNYQPTQPQVQKNLEPQNLSNLQQVNPANLASNANNLKKKRSFYKKPYFILAMLTTFLILISSLFIYLYFDVRRENEELRKQQDGNQVSNADYQRIVNSVKKLIEIEDDEIVNVGLVDNLEELKTQNPEFYKDAQIGQYLVVMPKSQRVILFDDSKQKIVNFSSYSITVEVIADEKIPDTEKPFNIEIRYSDKVNQETVNKVKDSLSSSSKFYSITSTSQTSKAYEGVTLVILNRVAKPNMTQNIIAHTGTTTILEKLPEGELTTTADALIILGNVAQ